MLTDAQLVSPSAHQTPKPEEAPSLRVVQETGADYYYVQMPTGSLSEI